MLDRIPYEIFSKIIKILYTRDIFYSFHPSKEFDEINVPPIKATHVCRSWRKSLLSDPTMWICIRVTDSDGTKPRLDQVTHTLEHSGSSPLHISIELRESTHLDFMDIMHHPHIIWAISEQMHRCRQLQIEISSQQAPFIFHRFVTPPPILQKFYLHVELDRESLEHESVLLRLHETLFSGHVPSLEHLNLQIVDDLNNIQLALFQNLSSLHLLFDEIAVIRGDILLDILQASPHLRTLDMKWVFEGNAPIVWMSSDRIKLPYLRDLSLRGRGTVDTINLVLGHLDFPMENVMFNIECEDSYYKMSNSTILLHFLSHRRFTFISVSNSLSHSYVVIEFLEAIDQRSTSSRFKTTSTIVHACSNELPEFLRTFNALDVTHMSLENIPFTGVILRNILLSLENLQYLRVQHGNSDEQVISHDESGAYGSYLKALLPSKPTGDSKSPASSEFDTGDSNMDSESDTNTFQGQLFPCPSLRTLEILLSDNDAYEVTLDEAHLPALSRCSRIREQAGHPLKCIVDCGGLLDLAKDIEVWLRTHDSGLSIEVKVSTAK